MKQEQDAENRPENTEKPGTEKKLLYRLKNAARKRPVLTLATAGIVLFLGGAFVASLLIPGLKSEMAVVDGSGVPGYDKGITEDMASPNPTPDESQGGEPGTVDANVVFDPDKIIYIGNISLRTDDYKGTLTKIEDYTKNAGGFVQDSMSYLTDELQNRDSNSGSITISIPAAKFESAMKELQKYGIPISTSVNSTNISQQYQDIAGQLESLKIQEERLLEYLGKAEKIQDMLTIESELSRVRTEMDYRTTMIKNWDTQVAYSTIYIAVYEQDLATTEVKSPFDDMLGKIKESVITSLNFLLYLTSQAIIWFFRLLPFALIVAALYFLFIWRRNKKKAKQK